MPSNEYHFVSNWRVTGTIEEVSAIVEDLQALPQWWPAVYLNVTELRPAGEAGVGRRVALLTKGWLPYTLRWQALISENRHPNGFTLEASGDFDGRGVWTFEQAGDEVAITFDWRLRAEKPLVRSLSPVLKPMFSANHRWAMARGEESLRLELVRRRAPSDAARQAIPAPPGPTSNAAFVLGGLVAALVLIAAFRPKRARGHRP